MNILAKAKQKRQEKFSREFISLFDSVLYLGEPLNEALDYIIECVPHQAKLYLTSEGCTSVFIGDKGGIWGDEDDFWHFGYGLNNYEMCFQDIVKELTKCIKQKHIEPSNPIYNLGFGKKRFLSYLQSDDIEISQTDLENAQSPTPIFDEYVDLDYYTVQSIINERDELRQLVDELKTAKASIAELEQKQAGTDKLHTRTANNASKIILAMAELLQWDLSEPYGKDTNGKIREVLDKQGNELSKDTVALWLKQAYDIGK